MYSAEWNQLHSRFYRKADVYDMIWSDMHLDQYVVVAAEFGGPIAVVPDERGMQQTSYDDRFLRIFTSSGKLISSFTWSHKGLVNMGWTSKENLVTVLKDGNVHIFSMHGDRVTSFNMGPECIEDGVAQCFIWNRGLVVRTIDKNRIFVVTDFDNPRSQRYSAANLLSPPFCMTVRVSPSTAIEAGPNEEQIDVLLATQTGSIIKVGKYTTQEYTDVPGPFALMKTSLDGNKIACYSDVGTLYIMSHDFSQKLSQFATKSKICPSQMCWCGDDAVVLYWPKILLMVSPHGDFVKYTYDEGAVILAAEIDGVRIITEDTCEFLSRVPSSTVDIFKIGSISPAAVLYDASEAYEQKNAKADEYVRSIKTESDLEVAIDRCIDAAVNETEHAVQKKLLKAAAYGKLFCDNYNPDVFVETCRTIRILNAVREIEVGIPITYQQYLHIDAEVLVDRVTQRYNHLLAIRMCEYLKMHPDRVLIHWAITKIQTSSEDDDAVLAQQLLAKLKKYKNISYSGIASKAFEAGRQELATLLLEHETHTMNQIQLLLVMKEYELALNKACTSQDTDLIMFCVLHMKENTVSQQTFYNFLRPYPSSVNAYVSYCKKMKYADDLKNLFYAFQRPLDAANLGVFEAYKNTNWKKRITALQISQQFYHNNQCDVFAAQMTDEQIKLLQHEKRREIELEDDFVDLSVSKLVERYISHGQIKDALKIKNDFQIPELRFWYLHVLTLVKSALWEDLARLSKAKPPFGFAPIVDACIQYKAYNEAFTYIMKLSDYQQQMEYLCNISYWKEAAEIAHREKDTHALHVIRERCKNPQIVQWIDALQY